jgi:hypothetical protein
MRLNDLHPDHSRIGAGRTRFETLVADITGPENHRLVIDGPEDVVREMFSDGEIDIHIDPNGTRRDWYERYEPIRQQELDLLTESVSLDRTPDMFLPPPPKPDLATSVLASLQRIGGHGSIYVHPFHMYIAAGFRFDYYLPFVCTCMGVAAPAAVPAGGNVDLALSIGNVTVATSANSPSGAERVTFSRTCWPWANFLPVLSIMAVTDSFANGEFAGATFFP